VFIVKERPGKGPLAGEAHALERTIFMPVSEQWASLQRRKPQAVPASGAGWTRRSPSVFLALTCLDDRADIGATPRPPLSSECAHVVEEHAATGFRDGDDVPFWNH